MLVSAVEECGFLLCLVGGVMTSLEDKDCVKILLKSGQTKTAGIRNVFIKTFNRNLACVSSHYIALIV